jgi:O-antigen/teichoic acid export membrane protein
VPVLQVLLASTALTVLASPLAQALHGTRHVRLSPVSGALQVAAAMAGWAFWIPSMGALGAALGLLASAAAGALLYHVAAWRWMGLSARAMLRPWAGLVAAVGAGAAVGAWVSPWAGLAVLAVVGLACFWREARLALRLAIAMDLRGALSPQ